MKWNKMERLRWSFGLKGGQICEQYGTMAIKGMVRKEFTNL